MTVGPLYSGITSGAVSDVWNGTSWVAVTVPNGTNESLWGLSCLSRTFCMAVGGGAMPPGAAPRSVEPENPIAYQWNGSSWSELSTPSDPEGFLEGVSCTSTTNCEAVGWSEGSSQGALTERWHGSTWSVVANPESDAGANLVSVSCLTSKFCVSVGQGSSAGSSLIEQWDGARWSVMTNPDVAAGTYLVPLAVSCSSESSCLAVGQLADDTSGTTSSLIDAWNGQSWTNIPSPVMESDQALQGVDCYASNVCLATGNDASGSIVLKWKPKGVIAQNPPAPSPSGTSWLGTISCVNGWVCVIQGADSQTPTGQDSSFFAESPIALAM
jgi:hypothetical protein